MEIFINGESIPFELEEENNAFDIIQAISSFAAKLNPQQFITSIFMNDREYSYADEQGLKEVQLDSIQKIEIETSDVKGITLLSISQIKKFLIYLENTIQQNQWDSSLAQINESIAWMKEGIDQIVSIFSKQKKILLSHQNVFLSKCKILSQFFQDLKKENFPISQQEMNFYLNVIKEVKEVIEQIAVAIGKSYVVPSKESLEKELTAVTDMIEEAVPKLANIPIMFQTGEDKEAMIIIQHLTHIIEKCINLFVIFKESFKLYLDQYTVKEASFEEFFNSITDHFKELVQAIENNDSVMIADLLEYEFLPNIEEIKNILEKIKSDIFSNGN